jgi:hypothetical protein
MRGDELFRLGPESRNRLGSVVEGDGEPVSFVVVLHILEDVVVYFAEKVYVRLYTPVPPRVGEGRVLVKEPAVPTAHLVVGDHVSVLDVLFFEDLGGLVEEGVVDPAGDSPVLFGDNLVVAFCLCGSLGFLLELCGKRLVVEERPGVIEFAVPCSLKIFHGLDHAVEFAIADQG